MARPGGGTRREARVARTRSEEAKAWQMAHCLGTILSQGLKPPRLGAVFLGFVPI